MKTRGGGGHSQTEDRGPEQSLPSRCGEEPACDTLIPSASLNSRERTNLCLSPGVRSFVTAALVGYNEDADGVPERRLGLGAGLAWRPGGPGAALPSQPSGRALTSRTAEELALAREEPTGQGSG